jgi:tetratricopeptide (TPR) repeat protein/predicted aspartyl protease
MLELPVTMAGLEPRIPVKINGEPATFLLDSGAFFSLINPSKAAQFHLTQHPLDLELQGVAGVADATVTRVNSFTLGNFELKSFQFIVASNNSTDDVAGILGQNILDTSDVEYDLPHGALRFFHAIDCANANLAYWGTDRVVSRIPLDAIDRKDPHTSGFAYVNGVRVHVIFDTGAAASVLSRQAAARAGVNLYGAGVTPLEGIYGMGKSVMRGWLAPVASFKLGDEEVRNFKIQVAELSGDTDTDMLLGADFFISHRVLVANSQRRLYFSYEGGQIFRDKPASYLRDSETNTEKQASLAPKNEPEPTTADGFAGRGANRQSQSDLDGALKDMTRAIELAPGDARFYKLRAAVHIDRNEFPLAISDLNSALKLAPDDAAALVQRGVLKLGDDNQADALNDLDAANRIAPKEADLQLKLARAYSGAERYEQALAAYDKWLSTHPDNALEGEVHDSRCWTLILQGQDFESAMGDCNRAVRMAPDSASPRESRGLAHLRRGETDAAIVDFDAALKHDPKLAVSLVGRGLAKLRLGKTEEAKADLAAGLKLDPKLKELFLKRGVAKPGEL